MVEDNNNQRRQYARVQGLIWCVLDELTSSEALEEAIAAVQAEPVDQSQAYMTIEMDPALNLVMGTLGQAMDLLEELNRKIDRLSAVVESGEPAGAIGMRALLNDLSGGGFSVFSKTQLPLAGRYSVDIELCRFPRVTARAVAEVKRCRPLSPQERPNNALAAKTKFDVGFEISHIRESDRDKIIHYVFRLQRESIRAAKNGSEESEKN